MGRCGSLEGKVDRRGGKERLGIVRSKVRPQRRVQLGGLLKCDPMARIVETQHARPRNALRQAVCLRGPNENVLSGTNEQGR